MLDSHQRLDWCMGERCANRVQLSRRLHQIAITHDVVALNTDGVL